MSIRGFFFFQAEDGIRDVAVTGVQTCALPISRLGFAPDGWTARAQALALSLAPYPALSGQRSEERRVGKSVDLGGRRIIKKKKRKPKLKTKPHTCTTILDVRYTCAVICR